jgi:hypothetical protein
VVADFLDRDVGFWHDWHFQAANQLRCSRHVTVFASYSGLPPLSTMQAGLKSAEQA